MTDFLETIEWPGRGTLTQVESSTYGLNHYEVMKYCYKGSDFDLFVSQIQPDIWACKWKAHIEIRNGSPAIAWGSTVEKAIAAAEAEFADRFLQVEAAYNRYKALVKVPESETLEWPGRATLKKSEESATHEYYEYDSDTVSLTLTKQVKWFARLKGPRAPTLQGEDTSAGRAIAEVEAKLMDRINEHRGYALLAKRVFTTVEPRDGSVSMTGPTAPGIIWP